jgi:TolB-like protein/DNA-binding winged helix-turn-helix (wHTH) protein/Tfp pilus assembly protein PilF
VQVSTRTSRMRFGPFEADLRSGELRKDGLRVKLQDQPFQVLAMLIQRPGEIISRKEFRQELWPADTFVDFDTSLNTVIKKLRDALGDSADEPHYIETLPRRGYRLIVPVENVEVRQGADRLVAAPPANGQQIPEPAFSAASQPTGLDPHILSWRKAFTALVVLGVLAMGSWWLFREYAILPYTIAVLPFKNLSVEPDSDYFSDGLTDEVIGDLSIIDGLEVKSRTSSFFFKDKPTNIHDVGTQLGVKFVLEGSVLRVGQKLRVNARLVRVSDDVPLWSNSFDRELKDVFAIQDEISRSIVNELRLNLGRGQRRYNANLEAYELYLKAQTLTQNQGLPEGRAHLLEGINLFEQVVANDPAFAPAYAGLATSYGRLSITPRSFPPDEAYAKMRAAAEKALQLDPLLAEAYASMGLVYARDHNWQESERSFRRSIELNANLSESRKDFAFSVLFPLGRLGESNRELRKALELDPLSAQIQDNLDYVLVSAGRYDEAIENCRRVLLANPNDNGAEQLYARALMHKGRLGEAIAIFEKQDRDGTGSPGFLGYAYAMAGRPDDAKKIAAKYPDWPWVQVFVYAGLSDKDGVFQALEEMAAAHDPRVGMYLTFPELAQLRGDPRLAEFRQSLGMAATP